MTITRTVGAIVRCAVTVFVTSRANQPSVVRSIVARSLAVTVSVTERKTLRRVGWIAPRYAVTEIAPSVSRNSVVVSIVIIAATGFAARGRRLNPVVAIVVRLFAATGAAVTVRARTIAASIAAIAATAFVDNSKTRRIARSTVVIAATAFVVSVNRRSIVK
jgi:hypothetical protein